MNTWKEREDFEINSSKPTNFNLIKYICGLLTVNTQLQAIRMLDPIYNSNHQTLCYIFSLHYLFRGSNETLNDWFYIRENILHKILKKYKEKCKTGMHSFLKLCYNYVIYTSKATCRHRGDHYYAGKTYWARANNDAHMHSNYSNVNEY